MTADLSNFHIAMICIAYRMGWAMDGKLGPKPHLTPTKGYILFVHKRTQNEGLISVSIPIVCPKKIRANYIYMQPWYMPILRYLC